MTIESFLEPKGVIDWIALLVMGVGWFVLTVCILCLMEVRLSALSYSIVNEL